MTVVNCYLVCTGKFPNWNYDSCELLSSVHWKFPNWNYDRCELLSKVECTGKFQNWKYDSYELLAKVLETANQTLQ